MNKPRVLIIHGWGGHPGEHWMPWLKGKLEAADYEVTEPAMPHTNTPSIKEWVNSLSAAVGEVNEHTYFVGHSVGCQAIMRYLQTIPGRKVGGCVFVAGWFKLENLEDEATERVAKPWVEENIDFDKIISTTTNITVINSSNDDYGCVTENKELFEKKLKAKVIILKNQGHLTAADGVTELPEAFAAIQEFSFNNKQT